MSREYKKKMEKQLAENRKTVEEWLARDSHHKKPVTRRDFLVAGVQASMGTIAAPSIFTLLDKLNRAHADCAAGGDAALVPWIQFNQRGGHSLGGNWAPFDAGDNKLPSYTTLSQGQNPDIITNVFGNGARFYDTSGVGVGGRILQGLRETAGDAILANASFVGAPCRSTDDSSSNNMDGTGIVMNAGLVGTALPNLRDVNHRASFGINSPAPLNVNRFEDLAGALGFAGALGNLDSNQLPRVAKLVQDLSTSQARRLASLSGGQNISDLMECATGQNYDNIANQAVDAIDPRNDAAVAGIYDLNNRNELTRAAMVYNCLNGVAGPTTIERGGYDYHNQGRASQDQDDLETGREIGKVLQMAAALNKKVFIPIISDGSVSCSGTAQGDQHSSDSGSRGCNGFIAYDPAGAPATNGTQIGSFTSGQVADRSFTSGDSPERNIAAIIVNWARMSGDINLALRALPNNTFSTAQIDQILRIV